MKDGELVAMRKLSTRRRRSRASHAMEMGDEARPVGVGKKVAPEVS